MAGSALFFRGQRGLRKVRLNLDSQSLMTPNPSILRFSLIRADGFLMRPNPVTPLLFARFRSELRGEPPVMSVCKVHLPANNVSCRAIPHVRQSSLVAKY